MEVTVLTEQRKTAIELNQKIILTAQLAQKNLYDMCVMLKQMRDDKLYKELGYSNFGEYCEQAVGMKRSNAYNYIAIIEKVENVQSIGQIGMTKLSLLASLSEIQQEEIQQTVNLEETSVRELKAECDRLKAANKKAESNLKSLQTELDNEKKSNEELMSLRFEKERAEMQLKRTREELDAANDKITSLENKPAEIEIAIQEDEEGKIAKTRVKELEQQLSETKSSHANALETQKQQYQSQINELETQLEQAKNKPAETIMVSSDKETFKAYYLPAVNAFENMLKFVADCSDKDFCIEKAEKLLEICREKLGEIT